MTPWLYAIARHKLIDAWRRRGRRIEIDIDEIAETFAAAPEPDRPSGREIGKALSMLAPGQRSVVAAISVEGRSIGETAARLGMSGNGGQGGVASRPGSDCQALRTGAFGTAVEMKTDDLIRALGADSRRPAMTLAAALAAALAMAVLVAAIVFAATIGPRPDIAAAAATARFPFKFVVTILLAATAFATLAALARPQLPAARSMLWLAAAPLLLAAAVALELAAVPAADWGRRLVGGNSLTCLTLIPLIGIGPLALFVAALRHGAPAHPVAGRRGRRARRRRRRRHPLRRPLHRQFAAVRCDLVHARHRRPRRRRRACRPCSSRAGSAKHLRPGPRPARFGTPYIPSRNSPELQVPTLPRARHSHASRCSPRCGPAHAAVVAGMTML